MVNFMCQLDWAKRCSDSWWTLFQGVIGYLWKRLAFESVEGVKKVTFANAGGHQSSNPLRPRTEQKGSGRVNSLSLLQLRYSSSLAFRYCCSWCLGFWTQTRNSAISFPNSPAFRLGSNDTASFPDSPGSRQQIMGLLGSHNGSVCVYSKLYYYLRAGT